MERFGILFGSLLAVAKPPATLPGVHTKHKTITDKNSSRTELRTFKINIEIKKVLC
jgi:hypothetical protein